MKIIVNSKELREAINAVLLKGKWNLGADCKNHQLNSSVILEVDTVGNCSLFNGDEATYVEYRIEVSSEFLDIKVGRVCLDTTTLLKYLKGNEEITLTHDDSRGILEITTGTSVVSIPTLERHNHSDSIYSVKEKYSANYTDYNLFSDEGLKISNRTILKTILKIESSEIKDALKACEIVGSGIFKLVYAGDNILTVSSNKLNEEMKHTIVLDEVIGPHATVEFTAPLHLLMNEETLIAFNDNSPVCIMNNRAKILRAPRVGDEA